MYQKAADPIHHRSPGRWHWTALLIIIVFLFAAFWISSRQIGMVDQQFRSILMDQVSSIAQAINPERAAALTFTPTDRMNPSFRRLNHQFKTYLTSLDCRGIYTIAMRDGRILFGPESYAEDDPLASPPGTVYLYPTAAVIALFEDPREFVEGPYEDEYGTFVSAYAPVMDSGTGEPILFVGIDVEASVWKAIIRSAIWRVILHGSVIAVVLLGGAWVLWFRYRMNIRWRRLLHRGEVYYAALVGLLLTAVTAEFLHDMEARARHSVFMEVTHSHINQTVSAFSDFRDHRLGAVARFCENSIHVDLAEFKGFTDKILGNRGIEGLFWVPAVRMEEKETFLKDTRSEGPLDYQIWDDNRSESDEDLAIENHPVIYPVRYAEPSSLWKDLPGYDMGSSDVIRPYIEKSIESNLPISMPIQMRNGVSYEGETIQIIYPVFKKNSQDRQFKGFIVATLELEPFLQAVFASGQQIADDDVISFFLLDSKKEPKLVGSSKGKTPGSAANIDTILLHQTHDDDLIISSPLFAFGDTYALVTQPGLRFLHKHPLRARWISWFMGVLITGLVTMFVAFITRHRIQLENQVRQRTIELQEREKFLAATLRSIGDGVISTDPEGIVTGINVIAEKLTGWFAPEAIGTSVGDVFRIIHSRTRGPAADPVQVVLKTRRAYELANHTALIARDGTESQIADSCAPILSTDGQIKGAVLVFRDVTKEYTRREELRRIRKAVDSSSDAIGICDATGKHFYQNDTFTKLFGYTIDEVRELMPKALYVNQQIADDVFAQIMGGGSWSGELEMVAKDGQHFDIFLRADAVRDEDGKTVSLLGIHTDITDQKKAREALMKSREQYILAANGSHDGMWDWDLISNNLFLSPRWKQMIGYRDNELPSSFEIFADHLHPDDKPVVMDYVKRYLNAEFERYSIEFRFRHRNGSYRWILARGEALRNEKGIPYRMAGSHTDITERKEAEEELRKTNTKLQKAISRAEDLAEQAARANASKSDFLANVSHEIRTPMNGVIGMTRMLLDSTLSPDQKHYADLAYSSAKALLGIIDDILDFSKIEAGKLTLESSDFDLLNTLENVTELLTIKAEEKKLEVVSILDSDIPSRVHGDPGRLRQILLNLGGNAVKFTRSGSVTIHGSLESQSASQLTIRFTVTDTGIGIAQEKQHMLFSPFTQVDQSARRKYGGTGLGLAISRQLVEAMGGNIDFKSSEGAGSEFRFTVVLRAVQTMDRIETEKLEYEFPPMRMMVVDENPAIHLQIRMLLNRRQEDFEVAENGASALDRLRTAIQEGIRFNVILVNQMLQDMDVEQFAERLKDIPGSSGVGLIVMTPMGLSKVEGWLPEIAVSRFLKKPVRKSTLYRCLSDVMARTQHSGNNSETVVSAGNGFASPEFGLEGTRILLVEDHPVNLLVTLKMLERLGCKTETAGNGLMAIDALKQKRFDLVLMDCQMPEMDGFEATRIIRDPASGVIDSSIPIVAMTAHAGAADREKCMAAGMSEYLSKPVESDDLAAMIKYFLTNG